MGTENKPNLIRHCPICGYELYPEGVEAEYLKGSFEICPCCFCEYGFDDTAEYREKWIRGGCQFHSKGYLKPNWNPMEQLKNADYSWDNPNSQI